MEKTIIEKLDLKDEKIILIQGLPSSLEKKFSKLSVAKNVTPLLKSRKIDFALIFAVNETQLNTILQDVLPALRSDSKLWIAFPQTISKVVTDLNKVQSWDKLLKNGYEILEEIELDHVWRASRFVKAELPLDSGKSLVIELEIPDEMSKKDIKQRILKIALLADEEHRLMGGNGLKISDINIEQHFPVLDEVII